jgi:TPR repeat protein
VCETGRYFHHAYIINQSYLNHHHHAHTRDYYRKIMSTTNTCANCGKGEDSSGDLKACTACKMVNYCNRECQIANRPQHKKACRKRAAELHDENLFKEHAPDECPICMLPLPLHDTHTGMTFRSCCGKSICDGCEYAMDESGAKRLCAYCRTPNANSEEEEIERTKQLMKNGNADAFYQLAGCYADGDTGLPQDRAKANELWLKAGELGCAQAYHNLGSAYRLGRGVEVDKKKAKQYYELAAMNGNVQARYNLGVIEGQTGNHERAMKHLVLSARAGGDDSLGMVKRGYMHGDITKDEYANTLREYQKSQDEMKSDARDKAQTFYEMHG